MYFHDYDKIDDPWLLRLAVKDHQEHAENILYDYEDQVKDLLNERDLLRIEVADLKQRLTETRAAIKTAGPDDTAKDTLKRVIESINGYGDVPEMKRGFYAHVERVRRADARRKDLREKPHYMTAEFFEESVDSMASLLKGIGVKDDLFEKAAQVVGKLHRIIAVSEVVDASSEYIEKEVVAVLDSKYAEKAPAIVVADHLTDRLSRGFLEYMEARKRPDTPEQIPF